MSLLPEWRVTRPALYPINAPVAARDGHYIRAATATAAAASLRIRRNIPATEILHVQAWKDDAGGPALDRQTVHLA